MKSAIYTARWVLPIDCDPIPDGEVIVEDGRIVDVRSRRSPANEVRDFGDAILLPGLVNAHSHLEYTVLRGFLEDVPFFPWIRALTAIKSHFTHFDWLCSAQLGALECMAGGITTIGDNTDAGVTMQVADESGMRGIIYQEVFGIDHRDPIHEIIDTLQSKIAAHRTRASERVRVGVSPHALYTVRPALFEALNVCVTHEHLPTSIHIAESLSESALTELGEGPFAEMFARREILWEAPKVTPTQYAYDQRALRPETLAIHCVQQTDADIALLVSSGAAVIHCPKSNGKLGAGIAPLAKWLAEPMLRVGLGTDSAVSNNTLDLFEEMRMALLSQRAVTHDVMSVTAHQMVMLATLGGARAMNLDTQIGSLTPGKRADLTVVGLNKAHAVPATDPYGALVFASRADDVIFTMCDGVVLYDQGAWPTLDASQIFGEAKAIRQRVQGGVQA